ncbi:MAG TPA: 2Fe-2S iron-sulfur cluster-binding protein [Accumulibacter sp.]|uniref:2Fe-2S iron-sulfur cluster-binding protein n=6 Tax=Accumulibacter sp. TaxID=2053492 RepID=UPI002D19051A|nr:2Fe-2S iron-sulfur cluster-binding protein [Accumulibacter sp.]HND38682.1 2Fe-2S iron-sulfur cluster-binding protein [Accumulibacter sp.]HNG15434.1 2Fe-2S iron-sulfur cluster-binding protein [Accumulibacter sp.]HNG86118.1 2Fe-2S iron-sulfur cluster-binding protein [Accumulibacter sp.]HNI52486.1 2Fe-2S iron-sulfur cluster-binding protein [Accumulibacter sp.]
MVKFLQQVIRWLFMRLENVFNIAFGEKLNPFYHLGTISFWQFWLLLVSGLYLYIFADTGVHDAFESVERITHDQWWAGGILRSIHRYATDGMILTMLLHMLRHFAYDRYRGFRSFSWLTGVALLWLIYIAGVNGFMLVWDKLAQFVVIATAEWFDVLPMFNGTLIRNFLYLESVNSRLFTLLAFVHIGAPLIVGFIMWVHVQRVPRAHINPPRDIALAVTLMYFVLAIAKPILSQGGEADMSVVPTNIEFDWFELPVLALVYVINPMHLWYWVIGLTAFLFVLPWLPPKRRGALAGETSITFHPDRKTVHARFGETLLDAGLRQAIDLPYECRNGGCGVCKCTVLQGQVDPGLYQPSALSAAELAQGKVLLCCATALADVEIEYRAGQALATIQEYTARVARLERLAPDVMRVLLALPEGQGISFKAGQYINIILADGERRAFSFANAPHEPEFVELQIRLMPGGRFTTYVFEQMKEGDSLRFEGPIGDFTLRESSRPIVFVAGATGFAPVKSMVEDAFQRGLKREIYLYWGVRTLRDLYLPGLPEAWAREHPNFHFIPVLSEPTPADAWNGRTGLVHEAILEDFPELKEHEIYACGSVRMVEAIFPFLKKHGAEDGACFSDAFSVSARSLAFQPRQS